MAMEDEKKETTEGKPLNPFDDEKLLTLQDVPIVNIGPV